MRHGRGGGSFGVSFEPMADASSLDPTPAADPGEDRRREIHEANNRLASIVMNLAFARATLDECQPETALDASARADLETTLDHATDAANLLTAILRRLA